MNKDLLLKIKEEFRSRREKEKDSLQKVLAVAYPVYDEEEIIAALDCLLDLRLSQGPIVKKFEKETASYMGVEAGVATNSGTAANMIALNAMMNLGYINKGEEVILPAATFSSVVSPIYQLGLIPVYVDVSEDDWFMDLGQVQEALTDKTKVIMPVYNLGFPGEIEQLIDIASEKNIKVLEDCCEAHGGERQGKKLGSFGDVSTLSFFVAHNITTGEGGMVFTSNKDIENSLRELREFGRMFEKEERFFSDNILQDHDVRYVSKSIGYNCRMTDFTAAMGSIQLSKLDSLNAIRREVFSRIASIFNKHEWLSTLHVREKDKSAHYGFPILIDSSAPFSRKDICMYLESNGIETRSLMMGCLPDQPAFRDLNHRIVGDLSFSRVLRDQAFFIGCHPAIEESHLNHLEEVINNFYKNL